MIIITCDRCERTLTIDDDLAGQKVECPYCHDINTVPNRKSPAAATPAPRPSGSPAAPIAGAPDAPADQTERLVLLVRPSLWRRRPLLTAALALLPISFAVLAYFMNWGFTRTHWWIWWVALPALGWLALFLLWFKKSMFIRLEVTTRRVRLVRGLLSHNSEDLTFEKINSIPVTQTVRDRIFNIGTLGLSTSEGEGSEIELPDTPRPHQVKRVIDSQRGM